MHLLHCRSLGWRPSLNPVLTSLSWSFSRILPLFSCTPVPHVVLSHSRNVLSDSLVLSHFLLSQGHDSFSQIPVLSPSYSLCHSVALSSSRIIIHSEISLRFSDSRPLALPSSLSTSAITCSATGIFLSLLFNSRSLVVSYCYLLEAHFESI